MRPRISGTLLCKLLCIAAGVCVADFNLQSRSVIRTAKNGSPEESDSEPHTHTSSKKKIEQTHEKIEQI